VLVTGSQGTLGKPLVTELRKRGHRVWGCGLRHDADLEYVRADIADANRVKHVFNLHDFDACYHLAGEFGRMNGEHYPEALWRTNCLGTRNIIDNCLRRDVHLIFASSSEAYGDIATHRSPLYESDMTVFVPSFYNDYALSKWTNEKQIEMAWRDHGLKTTILRFFNVYGPGEHYNAYRSVVCQFIYRALHGLPITCYSETTRSFLYIDDWTNCVANVLHSLPCDTFNIASTEQVSMRELLGIVLSEIETDANVTYIDTEPQNVKHKHADVSKAMAQLGLKQSITLAEGIKRTVEWMKAQ
jgi:dTDP-glucose 4,6-dehydratase